MLGVRSIKGSLKRLQLISLQFSQPDPGLTKSSAMLIFTLSESAGCHEPPLIIDTELRLVAWLA